MLRLNNISLLQFKNYREASFDFRERIVGICGANGVGKTNLLDAIYYSCFTKSYFSRIDSQHVLQGASGFRIETNYEREGKSEKAVCILRETGKKEFSINDQAYDRMADHIGHYPAVFIAPDDIEIITGPSEGRRRFLDALISQTNHEYLENLIDYNRILVQRNSYLRQLAESSLADQNLLDVYDRQLSEHGKFIYDTRNASLQNLIPITCEFYKNIAGTGEEIELIYESQLHESNFPSLLKQNRTRDLISQRTNGGTHKDDINIRFKGQSFKSIASQGQRKSLLFALKLAEFETLKSTMNFAPLLLLDDVFEKLDEKRMHNLLEWVCVQNDGHIFITDTHCQRIKDHFDKLDVKFQLVSL